MNVGIEKIDLYASRAYLDLQELAIVRGVDPNYVTEELFCRARTVLPPYEDAVTLAVNATKKLLADQDIVVEDIELLIVGSESGVDCGKPISTWVHRLCDLSSYCRNFEIKHACYGGTGALKMASYWCMCNPGKKALVVNSDFTRYCLNKSWEYIGGGVGVAMLVSTQPQILQLELDKTGYWTREIYDTFRPTTHSEVMKDEESLFSYLDAMDGAFDHYLKVVGEIDFVNYFRKNIYHAPFSKMPFVAHKTLLGRLGIGKKEAQRDFEEKVLSGLCFHQNLGSCYGGSTFVSLMGLLQQADMEENARISLFSYGSGCQGEFYSALVPKDAGKKIRSQNIAEHINGRQKLTVEQYEHIEHVRDQSIDVADFTVDLEGIDDLYQKQYGNQGLLVLKSVKNYERVYGWS